MSFSIPQFLTLIFYGCAALGLLAVMVVIFSTTRYFSSPRPFVRFGWFLSVALECMSVIFFVFSLAAVDSPVQLMYGMIGTTISVVISLAVAGCFVLFKPKR